MFDVRIFFFSEVRFDYAFCDIKMLFYTNLLLSKHAYFLSYWTDFLQKDLFFLF